MLTPQFLFNLETGMQVIAEQEYQRLLANLWYSKVAKERPTGETRKQRLIWTLDTAGIQYQDRLQGDTIFEELLATSQEYEWKAATGGLEVQKVELEDLDGGGIDQASEWSRQVGAYAAYWPQKQIATLIRNGGSSGFTSYDGQIFFSNAHPINVLASEVGTFANIFTGAAASTPATDPQDASYPGALPIDNSVTVDVALANLQKAIAYIRGIRMPNGEDPRGLKPAYILHPPALTARIQQLTQAKFIAQAGTGGAGAADISMVIGAWGLGMPVECAELGAGFTNGSDTDYYIVTEQMASSSLGALLYFNREPFSVIYNGPQTDAQLARAAKFQWKIAGRNLGAYGHPYLLFKGRAS
jgi:phage major head subunit gpT-like protein